MRLNYLHARSCLLFIFRWTFWTASQRHSDEGGDTSEVIQRCLFHPKSEIKSFPTQIPEMKNSERFIYAKAAKTFARNKKLLFRAQILLRHRQNNLSNALLYRCEWERKSQGLKQERRSVPSWIGNVERRQRMKANRKSFSQAHNDKKHFPSNDFSFSTPSLSRPPSRFYAWKDFHIFIVFHTRAEKENEAQKSGDSGKFPVGSDVTVLLSSRKGMLFGISRLMLRLVNEAISLIGIML